MCLFIDRCSGGEEVKNGGRNRIIKRASEADRHRERERERERIMERA